MKRLLIIACVAILHKHLYAQNPGIEFEPYTFKSNSGTEVQAELGKLSVPENRNSNNQKTIQLQFVRFKSTSDQPGHPIIYLAGGPGGSGINSARGKRFELFMALREVADVIALDQRGTGLSNQIPNCSIQGNFELTQPGTMDYYLTEMKRVVKECQAFWAEQGIDLSAYNTIQNADDLDDLRKALGASKINLWGISYGSHLAFDYIKRYEAKIDRVVLTGLEGPDHTIKRPRYNQNFLEILNDRLQEDQNNREVYGDLIELMKEVLDQIEGNPVTTMARDPRSGQEFEVSISKLDVQLVTSYFLTKNPEDSKRLPLLYLQMKNGDYKEMGMMVAMLKMYAGRVRAMPLAMSGVSPKRWNMIEEESKEALLGRSTNFPFPDIIEALELPDLGDQFRTNPVSGTKALFFSGTLDGRTYLESAKELVNGFENGVHVIVEGAGHDLFMSTPEVSRLIVNFLSGGQVSSQSIKVEVPKFVLPN